MWGFPALQHDTPRPAHVEMFSAIQSLMIPYSWRFDQTNKFLKNISKAAVVVCHALITYYDSLSVIGDIAEHVKFPKQWYHTGAGYDTYRRRHSVSPIVAQYSPVPVQWSHTSPSYGLESAVEIEIEGNYKLWRKRKEENIKYLALM